MNQNAKKRNKAVRKTERAVGNAIGHASAEALKALVRGKKKQKKNKNQKRPFARDIGINDLVDSEYSLAVAFPESNVEGRIPDDVLLPTTARTLRMRTSVTASAGGRLVFVVNPLLKSHLYVGTVTDATGAIAWASNDHEDYTSVSANFARYRPVALGVRVIRGSSSTLNTSGELGSVQVSGNDTSIYPVAAGSFTTITNYESENVIAWPTALSKGGYRRVWIPNNVPSTSSIDLATPATTYGCGSFGALVVYGLGLPASEALVIETYFKIEVMPYGDTEYLFPGRVAVANQGGLQKALLNVSKWLAAAGNTVDGAVSVMEQTSVMSALNRAGSFIGRVLGIGGSGVGNNMRERILKQIIDEGKLSDMIERVRQLQPTITEQKSHPTLEESRFLAQDPLGASRAGSEASYYVPVQRPTPPVAFEPKFAPTVLRRSEPDR